MAKARGHGNLISLIGNVGNVTGNQVTNLIRMKRWKKFLPKKWKIERNSIEAKCKLCKSRYKVFLLLVQIMWQIQKPVGWRKSINVSTGMNFKQWSLSGLFARKLQFPASLSSAQFEWEELETQKAIGEVLRVLSFSFLQDPPLHNWKNYKSLD